MKERSSLAVLVVFAIVAFLVVATLVPTRMTGAAEAQLKISLITTSLGTLVALIAGVLLLLRAAAHADFHELLPLTIPLLAGGFIAEFHWSIAVVLGALGITWMIREIVGTAAERRQKSGSEKHAPVSEHRSTDQHQ